MWVLDETDQNEVSAVKASTALGECRRILGGEGDPFADEWRHMDASERRFWLSASRLPAPLANQHDWNKVPGDARARLKNSLYRAAMRAQTLLAPSANV